MRSILDDILVYNGNVTPSNIMWAFCDLLMISWSGEQTIKLMFLFQMSNEIYTITCIIITFKRHKSWNIGIYWMVKNQMYKDSR